MILEPDFTILGWKFYSEEDLEPDCRKVSYWAKHPDHGEVPIPWSPYQRFTYTDARLWLMAGRPGREGVGNLDRDDLTRIIDARHQATLEKNAELRQRAFELSASRRGFDVPVAIFSLIGFGSAIVLLAVALYIELVK